MWLSGGASASQAEGRGFESRHPLHFYLNGADVAQLVERLTRNEQVTGSSPVVGSIFLFTFITIVLLKEELNDIS
jgi:hypothetical protein